MVNNREDFLVHIQQRKSIVGILGTGYVGSTLGQHAARAGFVVRGYNPTPEAIIKVNNLHIKNFTASDDIEYTMESDIICICVPTPVTENKTPDLSYVREASTTVAQYLKKGQLIIVESTIAPGTTRNVILPILERSGLRVEKDFSLAFSPERVDPGNTTHTFAQIPKVVGGIGPFSSVYTKAFYDQFIHQVYVVSSPEAAEMTKILENTFRLVNVSLLNEISEYTKALGVNIFEVIHAASTKPFGFLPHFPGPGIGGHCIPVDPYYMLQDAKDRFDVRLGIVNASLIMNEIQPYKVVKEALRLTKKYNGVKRQHKALVIGVTYKPNIADVRETPAIPIVEELEKRNVEVSFYDPYVAEFLGKKSIQFAQEVFERFDIMILLTAHKMINYEMLVASGVPILDTRNALFEYHAEQIYNFFTRKQKEVPTDEDEIIGNYFLL